MLSNAYPIIVESPKVVLNTFGYTDARLRELRKYHNATHSFFRYNDRIVCLWGSGDDIDGGEEIEIDPSVEHEAVDKIIRHINFRTIIRNLPGLKPLSFYPFRTDSRLDKHDLVRDLLPEELKGVVCLKNQIEVHIRRAFYNSKIIPYMVISICRRWRLNRKLSELHEEGFRLDGLPVLELEEVQGCETVLAPSETAIGVVQQVSSDGAAVDTFEGRKSFPLSRLSLRKSKNEIEAYLRFKIGEQRAVNVMQEAWKESGAASNAGTLHQEIAEIAGYFCKWNFASKSGFSFRLGKNSELKGPSIQLEEPRFLFDVTPGTGETKPLSGLLKFGPYDSATFRPKEPKILVVCQGANRAAFSKTVAALDDGIADSKYFKKGFRELFKLRKIDWSIAEAKGSTPKHFLDVIDESIHERDYDLVIVEGDERQKQLPTDQNSFIRSKAVLLGMGIPVQGLKHENARKTGDWLGNVLGPMALQMYAKMGGVPWTLPSSADVDREVVVGIGSSERRETEFKGGKVRRIVGMTTFFANDGRFLMANTCRAVPYEEYFEELLRNLEKSIKALSNDHGWEKGDTVRIIFHVFKPIKNIEADVVATLVSKFPDYDIKFAFVTISTRHPFLLFDQRYNVGTSTKGNFVPMRGENVQLTELEALIQLRGRNEIKVASQGFTSPALVRIHERSTFTDLHHIVEQMMNFTHLSWKTFFPTRLPVSIFYADQIAGWLDRLENIPGWNPSIVNTALKRKKWFL